MSFRDLLDTWQTTPQVRHTDETYAFRLPLDSAAKLHALADLYDGVTLEQITTDILAVALDEVVRAMPYVAGDTVIREDEFGDPIYADAGPTPRFEQLRRQHLKRLSGDGDG